MNKLKQFKFIDPTDNETIYYLAEKEYDNYDDVRKQIWHREDEPARIRYYEDGRIHYEVYWINDKEHRKDGPARIIYHKDGSIEYEGYFINNKYHREDGPARIWYNKDGSIIYEHYYLDGKGYTKQEYKRELLKRNTKIGRELYE